MRSSCAIPRASLRSVFATIAESAARTCRVSMSTASNPTWANPRGEPFRERPCFQPNATGALGQLKQQPGYRSRIAGHLALEHQLSFLIHDADSGKFKGNIKCDIPVHCGLLR